VHFRALGLGSVDEAEMEVQLLAKYWFSMVVHS
jgi:hypothetical protein